MAFVFSSCSPDTGTKYDCCDTISAQRASLLGEILPTFISSLKRSIEKKSRLGGEKNWTTLQPLDRALPKNTAPHFPLLWLQISCAQPSCTNFSLAFKFRWQATLVAHLDSCKTVPSGSEGQLLKWVSKYFLEEFQVSLKPSTEITNYHCCLCCLPSLCYFYPMYNYSNFIFRITLKILSAFIWAYCVPSWLNLKTERSSESWN